MDSTRMKKTNDFAITALMGKQQMVKPEPQVQMHVVQVN